jgi:glutathione synthase/RimK-type ligase-like ATP-grasp enzyme
MLQKRKRIHYLQIVTKMKKTIRAGQPVRQEMLSIFSRHPSHRVLRNKIPVPCSASIRFGSTTLSAKGKKYKVQLNLPEAVECSSDKLFMKLAFEKNNVKTAPWCATVNDAVEQVIEGKSYLVWKDEETGETVKSLKFPVVTKHRLGSRGTGNNLHRTFAEFTAWLNTKSPERRSNYIIEQYMNYALEYRLHVSSLGECFYTCRKALRQDVPEDLKWVKNDATSVWLVEDNPEFFKPINWNEIVEECVKALNAVGLDVGAMDVRVQSATKPNGNVRETQEFIILESNSAPSLGSVTEQKYLEHLPRLIESKL